MKGEIVSRNYIKGHFYQGAFIGGIIFGIGCFILGYFWGTNYTYLGAIFVIIGYFLMDFIENMIYNYDKKEGEE